MSGSKFLWIFFVAQSLVSWTQTITPIQKIERAERLTVEDGLSQGFVYYTYQDRQGFVWISTKDGLNRYDGNSFKIFRNNPENPYTFKANESIEMLEDGYGNLWINSINKGVELFIREFEVFLHFNKDGSSSATLSSDRIHDIVKVADNEVWITTDQGVDVIRYTKNKFERDELLQLPWEQRINQLYRFEVQHCAFPSGVDPSNFRLQKLNDQMLVGRVGNRVCQVKLNKVLEWFPLPVLWEQRQDKSEFPLLNFHADSDHNRLVWVFKDSLFYWSPNEHSVQQIENRFAYHKLNERAIYFDHQGRLWCAHAGAAECVEWIGRCWNRHEFDHPSWPSLRDKGSMSMMIDRSGLWWVGTPGYGIIRYNADMAHFHHVHAVELDNKSYYGMYASSDSTALVMAGSRVLECNPRQIFPLKPKVALSYEVQNDNREVYAQAVATDAWGNQWLADGKGVFFIDHQNKTSKLIYTNKEGDLLVYTPLLVAQDQTVWYGSPTGLCHFTSPDRAPDEFTVPEVYRSWPDVPFIHAMVETDEAIWLGTVAGVFGINKQTHQWTSIIHQPDRQGSIGKARVYALLVDPVYPQKYLWAGLNGLGIWRIDTSTQEAWNMSLEQGLPNDVIYGLLSDDKGRIWASTNAGISCIQPLYDGAQKAIVLRNFSSADGLQSSEFNRYAYLKLKNGQLLFGGVNGLNIFYPEEVLRTDPAPLLAITDIRIRNRSLLFGSNGNEMLFSPSYESQLVLQPDQDMLSIEFAVMEFTNPSKNKFKYKLVGYTDDWIDAGFSREANFTNLDPGEYEFTVIGCSSEGVWNETGKTLRIVVLPHWWQTWYFKISLTACILWLLFFIYRYRINQLKKVQLVRDDIARDLHDEIGSTLSSIALYSDLVNTRTRDVLPDIAPVAQKISESSQRLMGSMSDIIWSINPDRDQLNDVVIRMREVASEWTDAAHLELIFAADKQIPAVKLNMQMRRNIYLIFREALNNAVKYAEASIVEIHVQHSNGEFVMEIKDNGKGFDLQAQKRGNGLLNMQKRAQLLKGTFLIDSATGQGTRIEVRFKL
jgi:ligand-binding sensor domain-containing protein/two-component sensor histidine kinase